MMRWLASSLGWHAVRVERVGVLLVLLEHPHVGRLHDEDPLHLVVERALHRGDDDEVALLQLVDVGEGGAVGGAVAGDGGVAGLPGERRLGVVAGGLVELLEADALHHDLLDVQLRDLDAPDHVADVGREVALRADVGLGGGGGVGGAGAGGGRAAGVGRADELGVLLAQLALGLLLVQARAPQLVGHEQQQEHADGDQHLADRPDDAAQAHDGVTRRRSDGVAGSRSRRRMADHDASSWRRRHIGSPGAGAGDAGGGARRGAGNVPRGIGRTTYFSGVAKRPGIRYLTCSDVVGDKSVSREDGPM